MAALSGATSGDLAVRILHALDKSSPLLSAEAFPDATFAQLKSAVDRLASRDMVRYDPIERDEAILEPEAEEIVANGSHEARVFEALRQAVEGLTVQELEKAIGDKNVTKVGQGKAFKEKWISKTSDGKLKAQRHSIEDVTQRVLQDIQKTRTCSDSKTLADLKKRKLVRMQRIITFKIQKGEKFALEIPEEATDLTADMLASGAWRTTTFKPYNFRALGADQQSGALHPLNKVRAEFRQIFFDMGFTEMPTGKYVETGFWNFDALFVPQQHPARDLQDTVCSRSLVRLGRVPLIRFVLVLHLRSEGRRSAAGQGLLGKHQGGA